MLNLTDTAIIDSVLSGNIADFRMLVERHEQTSFILAYRILQDRMEAEEVVQDSFLKAFKSLSSFRKESKFSSWLYRIVYNNSLNKLKSINKNLLYSLDESGLITSDTDSLTIEATESKDLVSLLLKKLTPRQSAIVTLFYFDNATCEEISEIIGMDISNVKVTLHRTRKILGAMIEKLKIKEDLYD